MTSKAERVGLIGTLLVAWSALVIDSALAQVVCFKGGDDPDCGAGYVCRTYKEVFCADGNCRVELGGAGGAAGRSIGGGGTGDCDGVTDWCEARTWGYCERP